MKPLSKELRNKFERTIENAREIAEEAARIALEQLGVGEASPYSYLSEDERALRRRLRAHGRNLGDVLDPKTETQEIDRLVEKIAYEHWHRMLFARFLAENDLLMYYEDDDIENAVPVTLSECDELAQELGMKNGWEVAAKLATKMLPQVFRADSPVFKVELPPEKQKQLENLVSSIEGDVFKASDSLGWTYQYWQNKRKASINESGVKISEDELPAVTQLFTEDYMVDFLIHNTIGSWYANKKLSTLSLDSNISEDEVRKLISRNHLQFEYLRLKKNNQNSWEPFSKGFDDWPKSLSEFKVLDPCCGSGHFLISVFLTLVPIRMEVENLSARDACNNVITQNIFGLEIEKRCVEIAVFALAMAAWKYPNAGGFRRLPEVNIAWCGQSITISKDEWQAVAKDDLNLKLYLGTIYDIFKNANILGSLINPKKVIEDNTLFAQDWEKVRVLLERKFIKPNTDIDNYRILAQGIDKALCLLGEKYQLVITNVPYLARGKQAAKLYDYCEKNYSTSKSDLATVFLERCIEFCDSDGTASLVLPQNWLFLKSYKELRENLLKHYKWDFVGLLGAKAFQTPMWDFNVMLLIISKNMIKINTIYGIDVSDYFSVREKAKGLKSNSVVEINQENQLENPDYRILLENIDFSNLLGKYVEVPQGIKTGDDNYFRQYFWENKTITVGWKRYQSTPCSDKKCVNSGMQYILRWGVNGENLARRQGEYAWGKKGVAISQMANLPWGYYYGDIQDSNINVVIPIKEEYLLPVTTFVTSDDFPRLVRSIDKKLSVTNNTFKKVPFNYEYWKKLANIKYPNGFPKPYTDDPTQWIFHGYPSKSLDPLQVAVARLLGYRWPAELDADMELSDEAKVLVEKSEGLVPYADKDGIVCIPSVRGEAPASERLLNLLAAAYKGEDINMILAELLSNSDHAGKSLESWLRDKFFTQHYKLFGHRPFIWQIWDGLKDGFSVLVNYHKLDRKNLEILIYTYLGDWISKQKSAMMDGIEGAEEKLNAAISLKKKLELILEGEAPYDIFVRWKPLNKQPLGWEPDLNDGVRVNIRPFMLVGDVGKKGAGVLRDKPNIKWNKDRGKDTENSPWYHLFGGDRINDHHLTLEEKKKAREDEVKFR